MSAVIISRGSIKIIAQAKFIVWQHQVNHLSELGWHILKPSYPQSSDVTEAHFRAAFCMLQKLNAVLRCQCRVSLPLVSWSQIAHYSLWLIFEKLCLKIPEILWGVSCKCKCHYFTTAPGCCPQKSNSTQGAEMPVRPTLTHVLRPLYRWIDGETLDLSQGKKSS